MDFFNGFLRGVALLPGVVQDTETLFGSANAPQPATQVAVRSGVSNGDTDEGTNEAADKAAIGARKKAAAIEIVGAAISMADAIGSRQIADPDKFAAGLSQIVDGIVACLNASIWAKR